MIIKCQEHYNKVVEYAKSIGDNTLQQCIERLQQWEKNSNGNMKLKSTGTSHPHSFGFAEKNSPTGGQESSEGTLSWQTGRIIRRDTQSVPWMEHTHLKIKFCKAHFPDK